MRTCQDLEKRYGENFPSLDKTGGNKWQLLWPIEIWKVTQFKWLFLFVLLASFAPQVIFNKTYFENLEMTP